MSTTKALVASSVLLAATSFALMICSGVMGASLTLGAISLFLYGWWLVRDHERGKLESADADRAG